MANVIRAVLQALRKSGTGQPAQAAPARVGEYYPAVFEAATLEAAKGIAITPEEGMSTEDRWSTETDFMVEHIASRLPIGEKNILVDFGCGVGRMNRALIERFGCSVVGVDQAQRMREHAMDYVASPRFKAVSTAEFDAMVAGGFAADFGLACWVLQHCVNPSNEIGRIANSLAVESPFLLVNSVHRLIPTNLGWAQDGANLDALMGERFAELERLQFPEGVTTGTLRDNSSISWWQRRV
jgi:SAM-dependent methyltransferase